MELWDTVPAARTALFVVHNGTTLDRLLDVAEVFADDLRVRIVVTSDLSDPFAEGLPEQVASLGLAAVPWTEAVGRRWDLVVAASYHGPLHELDGPLLALSHGAGFGKYAPGTRRVFGPDWLAEGTAATIGTARPAPGPSVLIGDPAFDDLLALSAAGRDPLAHSGAGRDPLALSGAGRPEPGRVVITSTWGEGSLLAADPGIIRATVDAGYRTSLVLHPNIWAWHGAHQIRLWLRRSLDAGLTLVPPLRAWRRELAAADRVIGDHGSVSVYAAALGTPTLLGAFPDDRVVPGSPAHRLGELAARYERGVGLDVQLDKAVGHPELAALVTAVPGEAHARLRATCYRLLDLEEPTC